MRYCTCFISRKTEDETEALRVIMIRQDDFLFFSPFFLLYIVEDGGGGGGGARHSDPRRGR